MWMSSCTLVIVVYGAVYTAAVVVSWGSLLFGSACLRPVRSSIVYSGAGSGNSGLSLVCKDACDLLERMKIHSSCEIEDFVETHLCKLCVILRSRVLGVVRPH